MFTYALDNGLGLGVVVNHGSSTDDDYAEYIETFTRFDRVTRGLRSPVLFLLLERDAAPPHASWRKKIAEASCSINSAACVAFVAGSVIARGIVQAINWVRPPPYSYVVVSTAEEALAWAETQRAGVRPLLQRMCVEARIRARTDAARQRLGGKAKPGKTGKTGE